MRPQVRRWQPSPPVSGDSGRPALFREPLPPSSSSAYPPEVRRRSPRCFRPCLATSAFPIFIVQHMPPLFTEPLAASLAGKCSLPGEGSPRRPACGPESRVSRARGQTHETGTPARGGGGDAGDQRRSAREQLQARRGLPLPFRRADLSGPCRGRHPDRDGQRRHRRNADAEARRLFLDRAGRGELCRFRHAQGGDRRRRRRYCRCRWMR